MNSRARKVTKGICPTCKRYHRLTFHHLIPKKMHRRNFFRKKIDKNRLQQGIYICRQCHDGIHKMYNEMHLAKHLNSLDSLLEDERLQGYFKWVSKQRVNLKQ